MNLDLRNHRAKLGPGEWLKIGSVVLGVVTGGGAWLWNMSDRMLLLEAALQNQTAILQRLDNDREMRAVQTEQLKELARRLERIETQKHGT